LKDYGSREAVFLEVRRQLQAALDPQAARALDDDNIAAWFLDPDIELPNPSGAVNLEPLLINTRGSWADRPDAVTRIPNLFLAADYVRTYTDLATMEGANEAARRAVNGVLDAARASAAPCRLWPLHEPAIFAPARALDFVLWKLGLPHGGLGRATTRELTAAPAIPRHSRTHRVGDAAGAAPAGGYQSMRKR
ncbi:MAG TPA: FAD-dependent oxidoreductase, partial [Polyangia bacterium]